MVLALNVRPVIELKAVLWFVATGLLLRLEASPSPESAKVSPFTPAAVRYCPEKVVPPS